MTHDIDVFGLSIVRDARPNKASAKIIANFNCTVGGIEITGCCPVRNHSIGLVIGMLKVTGKDTLARAIQIKNSSVHHALMEVARQVIAQWEARSRIDVNAA